MRKILFLSAAVLCLNLSAHGALSNLNQSLLEIRALSTSPEAANLFPQSEAITSVERVDEGYMLYTEKQEALVRMIYTPSDRPGPTRFRFVFEKPQPRRS